MAPLKWELETMKTSVAAVLGAGILAAAGVAASPATATTILTTVNQAVQGGGPYLGQFDLSSYLNQGGDNYEIVGAQVTATGFSNPQVTVTQQPLSAPAFDHSVQRIGVPAHDETQIVCDFFCFPVTVTVPATIVTDNYFNQIQDTTFLDLTNDTMLVDVGQGTGSGAVGTHISQTVPTGASGPFVTGGSQETGFNFTTVQSRNIINENYGALSAVGVLTANDLLTLNNGGLLNFTVGAPNGQFNLQTVQVDFELLQLPSGVPEPTTWAMLLLGVAGVGGVLRRRRAHIETV